MLEAAAAYQKLPAPLQQLLAKMVDPKPEARPSVEEILLDPIFTKQRCGLAMQYPPLPDLGQGKRRKLADNRGALMRQLVRSWQQVSVSGSFHTSCSGADKNREKTEAVSGWHC